MATDIIKKVAIVTTIYNRSDGLRNTLMGLVKQKISFPYEVLVVDDGSEKNPESIIREYIPDNLLKFKRFDKNEGPIIAKPAAYNMASEDSNIFVYMGSDVILLDTDCIEKLCKGVGEKIFTIGEVNTMDVANDMYIRWDTEVKSMKERFYKMNPYFHTYCGSLKPTRWYIFLGALRKEDVDSINFFGSCDMIYYAALSRDKFKAVFPMVKAVHQTHPTRIGYCPIVGICKRGCSRRKNVNKK